MPVQLGLHGQDPARLTPRCSRHWVYHFTRGNRLRRWEIGNHPGSSSWKTTYDRRKEHVMNTLTPRERELVALGGAMGSNCVPCIEHHIPEARKAGLTDPQISEAIRLADKVRQVPARKVLDAALGMLPEASAGVQAAQGGCAATAPAPMPGARCCG